MWRLERDERGGMRQEAAAVSSREVVMMWTGEWEEGRDHQIEVYMGYNQLVLLVDRM